MWCSAVLVVVVGCVISRDVSAIDVRDNAILSGESLQDLHTRTKKSPDVIFGKKKNWGKEDKKKTWNDSPDTEEEAGRLKQSGKSESEVSAEITELLAEDIKERLENLKEIENSYSQLKSDLLNVKNLNTKRNYEVNKPLNQEMKTILESNISEDGHLKESLRFARQYNIQNGQHYQQQLYGGGVMRTENTYTNQGGYHEPIYPTKNIYGDRGDPYLAQDNPSARTYGAAGIQGGEYEKEKKEHPDPIKPLKQLKQIIPNVINVLAEITAPAKPVQTPGYSAKPPVHQPIQNTGHGPHKPVVNVHQPYQHGKKPIGLEPIFYSKQVIFGIGADKKLHTKNYYGSETPEVYNYPTQSYYPSSYSYYSPTPASYWTPHREDYSASLNANSEGNAYSGVYPGAQVVYDPTFGPYPQGASYIESPDQIKSYYPADNNYNAPYLVNEAVPEQKNDDSVAKESSSSTLLMDSVPRNVKNQTVIDIESEIKKLQQNIHTIKTELGELVKQTDSIDNKESSSKTVKRNPSVYRRQAYDESRENNKVRNVFQGKFNEVTNKYDFVKIDH